MLSRNPVGLKTWKSCCNVKCDRLNCGFYWSFYRIFSFSSRPEDSRYIGNVTLRRQKFTTYALYTVLLTVWNNWRKWLLYCSYSCVFTFIHNFWVCGFSSVGMMVRTTVNCGWIVSFEPVSLDWGWFGLRQILNRPRSHVTYAVLSYDEHHNLSRLKTRTWALIFITKTENYFEHVGFRPQKKA